MKKLGAVASQQRDNLLDYLIPRVKNYLLTKNLHFMSQKIKF